MVGRRRFVRLQEMTTAGRSTQGAARLAAKTEDGQGFAAEPRRHVGGGDGSEINARIAVSSCGACV